MGTRAATAGLTMALLIVTATGCESDSDDAVRGSGDIVTEVREVSDFSEVHLEGSGDVVVEMGENESLTVEADDNLLELITTSVRGSRLVIEFELDSWQAVHPDAGRLTRFDYPRMYSD